MFLWEGVFIFFEDNLMSPVALMIQIGLRIRRFHRLLSNKTFMSGVELHLG